MIYVADLQKLVDHQFISMSTASELSSLSGPGRSRWMTIQTTIEQLISAIEKFELEHPLGMDINTSLYYQGGNWDYNTKKWKSNMDYRAEFSLEDIKNLYNMVRLLSLLDTI